LSKSHSLIRSGSKSRERSGGRKLHTPNKRTVLSERILALAAQHPTASRPEFLAVVVDDTALPADIRLTVARRSRPGPRPQKPASPSHTSGASVPTVTAQSLAALDPLLRIAQDITAAQPIRRKAAVDIALFLLPRYLGRRTKKWKRFPKDEFGFEVDPKLAKEFRDLHWELKSLRRGGSPGRKASAEAFAKKARTLRARIGEIERGLMSPPPETYFREKGRDSFDETRIRPSALDQDLATLKHFDARRTQKIVFSAEEDAIEAHVTARGAAFVNGPEQVARKRLQALEQKDGAFRQALFKSVPEDVARRRLEELDRTGRTSHQFLAPALEPSERDTLRLLRLLYPPVNWRSFEQRKKDSENLDPQIEYPFFHDLAAAEENVDDFDDVVLPEPFSIGDPNLPPELRLLESWIARPPRVRDDAHVKYVEQLHCYVCNREPAKAHAIRFTPHPRFPKFATDEYMVPLCAEHLREVRNAPNEMEHWRTFMNQTGRDPVKRARSLWQASHAVTRPPPPTDGPQAALQPDDPEPTPQAQGPPARTARKSMPRRP
jgi:hypothetical protein